MTPTQRPFELAWIPPGTAVPNPDQYVEHPEHQLDALRDSGKTNMFGARPYLEQAFGFGKAEAADWLKRWMQTFASRHGIEGGMMTILNGRFAGVQEQEFVLHTGSDGEELAGGKIYPVDPEAVARFKAILAQQPPRKPQPMQWRYRHPGIDPDLKQKAEEIAARARARRLAQAEEQVMMEPAAAEPEQELEMTEKNEIEETAVSETDVRKAHNRFVQGESIKELAQELGIPWQTLRAQFRQYGLSAGRVETAVVPAPV